MKRHTHSRISRRGFLQAATGVAGAFALGNRAIARRLVLVAAGERNPISQVEWIVYDTGLRDSLDEPLHRCAVRITTTAGVQGWADFESWTAPDAWATQRIRDILLGQDPADHDTFWTLLYQHGIPLPTLSAVDVALWDLRGRIEGRPVHDLLGTQRQEVAAYVCTGFNLAGPSEYADFALACKARGLQGVKIQSDAGSHDQDMAVYAAVREAVGPDFVCIAGGAAAYTFDQALSVGKLLDELGYAWFQSPMPEHGAWVSQYAALANELQTPLCAPESDPGSYESRITWFDRGACDIPRFDVHRGGLTACTRLAWACQARGIPLSLNNVGPDAYAHLQLAGATDDTLLPYIELLAIPDEPTGLPGRAAPGPVLDEQGYVAIPQTPGMGIDLDWQYIFTHRPD